MSTAMKSYKYKGVSTSGRKVSGKVDATDHGTALVKIKKMGLVPTTVKQTGTGLEMEITMPGSNRVSLKDLAIMSRQFATMISSGLSLLRALNILAEQTESKGLQKILVVVCNDVENGSSLSAALAKHDKDFPPIFINMTRAGEVGGFLETVLLQVADNFEKEVALRARIKAAMAYPVVVFVIAIIAVVGMLLFIVPVFEKMFSGFDADLPGPTKILVGLSEAMRIVAPALIVVGIAWAVVWSKIRHKEKTRKIVDPLIMKAPIFGGLVQKIAISRFSRNFGTMIASGVPILQCLSIVGETSGNYVISSAIHDVQDSVRRGESLSGPLASHKVFPAMMVQMLAVGEDTGAMDTMLHKLSDFYEQEVEATTDALASLIEPLMIAFLGSIIGGMIVALYLPIFNIFQLIQ